MIPDPERVAGFEARCRELGMPRTPQRRAIFEVLLGRGDHPSADDIAAALEQRMPGISRATVYRTLEALVSAGLVVRVCHPDAVARYDARTERHHHLVCDVCGAMVDLELPALDALALPELGAFRVRDYSLHVRGTCAPCQNLAGET